MTRQDYISENLIYAQQLIAKNYNFSIIKVGDGELDCMQNKEGGNIDLHPYSIELGEKLKTSLVEIVNRDFQKNNYVPGLISGDIYICDWFYSNPPINSRDECNLEYYNDFIQKNDLQINFIRPFELLMLGWGNVELLYLFDFYRTIKNSNRNKIYVGPERISGVKNLLNVDHFIEIPLINAFSSYNKIIDDIKSVIVDDSIIMLSIGLQSPAVCNELLKFNPNITILDIGSGFDPLYFAQTRGGAQASVEEAKNYFEKL